MVLVVPVGADPKHLRTLLSRVRLSVEMRFPVSTPPVEGMDVTQHIALSAAKAGDCIPVAGLTTAPVAEACMSA